MKEKHYLHHSRELRQELKCCLEIQQLKKLHLRQAWRHFLVLARQIILLVLCSAVLVLSENRVLWMIAIFVQGFTIFNFTVLLHEVVHRVVFQKNRPRLYKFLGYLYAVPSGISASQFTRWHLDHHDELGNPEGDPKRHHLTPKINKRWYKALYMTPALFPIYFRAAGRETRTYPITLQKTIRRERLFTVLFHFSILGSLWYFHSFALCFRLYMAPVFFVFPIAFTLNRLGQHYNINPEDPAYWGTRMKSSWFWNFWFLWSNFHLEHHYYPSVPFYRLPELNQQLSSFYQKHQIPEKTYRALLYGWFIQNQKPHTYWDAQKEREEKETPAPSQDKLKVGACQST